MATFPFLKVYPGWSPWQYQIPYHDERDSSNNLINHYAIMPFSKLPNSILPANKIWGQGISQNYALTVVGGFGQYTLGYSKYPPPTLGYCISDIYKENLYLYLAVGYGGSGFSTEISNPTFGLPSSATTSTVTLGGAGAEQLASSDIHVDVFQRSKLKRIYIDHGIVSSFTKLDNSTGLLMIDYFGTVPPSLLGGTISGNILVTTNKSDGTTITTSLLIKGLQSNWGIKTSLPSNPDDYPVFGSFYKFNKVWCVEDPLMMSGQWLGNENEKYPQSPYTSIPITNMPNSGYGVHITEHNKPYDTVSFTGAYIWKSNSTSSSTTSTIQTTSIISSQTPLDSIIGGEWFWIPFSSPPTPQDASTIYQSDDRYKFMYSTNVTAEQVAVNVSSNTSNMVASVSGTNTSVVELGNVAGVVTPLQVKFKIGTDTDFTDWKNLFPTNQSVENSGYVRMELNKGGSAEYQNWHSPNLTKCWFVQGNKYFQILNQPDGNVIDISLRDVSNSASLDTSDFAHGSIFNQYAWMLNEHYMCVDSQAPEVSNGRNYGIFGGYITSTTYSSGSNESTISINVVPTWETTNFNKDIKNNGTYAQTFVPSSVLVPNTFIYPPPYNPHYLNDLNSFYNRFRLNNVSAIMSATMIPMYDKMYNWKLVSNTSTTILDIKTIIFDTPVPSTLTNSNPEAHPDDYYSNETIIIAGTSPFNPGDNVYVTFDKPYKMSAVTESNAATTVSSGPTFTPNIEGDFFWNASLGNVTQGDPSAGKLIWSAYIIMDWRSRILLSFIPKETIIGVCGGRFWGIGELTPRSKSFVFSPSGANLLFATYFGSSCLSSYFNEFTVEDLVVYKDPTYNITTIRRGGMDFREVPRRSEISIGTNSFEETIATSPYNLNKSQDRLRQITFIPPDATAGSSGENIMVAVKNTNNLYGNAIAGYGEVDLQSLRKQGVANGVAKVSTFKFNSYAASPVYIYKNNKNNKNDVVYGKNSITVGVPTSDSPLYLLSSSTTTASGVPTTQFNAPIKAEYIKNVQALQFNTLFDFFRIEDGEEILVYGHPVVNFNVNGDTVDTTLWETSNAIFITGKASEAQQWGCPLIKTLEYTGTLWAPTGGATIPSSTDFEYPLMVLPCADYLGSIYHYKKRQLFIFARCYVDKASPFIGCYRIPYCDLLYKAYKATSSNIGYLDFLYRPLSLAATTLASSSNASPVSTESQLNLPQELSRTDNDRFTPVTSTQNGINVLYPFVTRDGTLAALYDSVNGINLAYSRNYIGFRTSPVIIVQNASSPLYIGDDILLFIVNNEIGMKIGVEMYLYSAMRAGDAGSSTSDIESIQKDIDQLPTRLIGSGKVLAQKMTGYKTSTGIYKVFFYSADNTATCMQSKNRLYWTFAPNF